MILGTSITHYTQWNRDMQYQSWQELNCWLLTMYYVTVLGLTLDSSSTHILCQQMKSSHTMAFSTLQSHSVHKANSGRTRVSEATAVLREEVVFPWHHPLIWMNSKNHSGLFSCKLFPTQKLIPQKTYIYKVPSLKTTKHSRQIHRRMFHLGTSL